MRVLLLNAGGYFVKPNTKFPVEVEGVAHPYHERLLQVAGEALLSVGFAHVAPAGRYDFIIGEECQEVLRCEPT